MSADLQPASRERDPRFAAHTASGLTAIDDLMAGGEMLPSQLPLMTDWSPCKKMAAAVLASALVEIRDHCGQPNHRRRVAEELAWVHDDDVTWPYAFVPLCHLFGLEVDWVRQVIAQWIGTPRTARKPISYLYRQAA